MTEDSELLRRYAQEHAEPAFAELVRRHVHVLYAAALRQTGNPTQAEEVVQAVFCDLARRADTLAKHPALISWLFLSTRFAARNLLRRERRRQQREQTADFMQTLQSSGADADWTRLRPVLDEAICELPDRDRIAVLSRYFQGLSFDEIARRLNLTEPNARQLTHRAVEKLQGLLAKRGVTSTAAALGLALVNQPTVAAPLNLAANIAAAVAAGAVSTLGLGISPSLFSIMSTHKIVSALTATAALLGAGFIVAHAMNRTNAVPEPVAAVAEVTPASVTAPTPTPTPTPAPAPANTTGAQGGSATKQSKEERQEERRKAKREANQLAKTRALTVTRLAPLFEKLTLTDEQKEKLIQLVMNDHEAGRDFATASAKNGEDVSKTPEDYWSVNYMLHQQFFSDVHELLGDDGYAAFRANDLAIRQSLVIDHLQARLAPASEPLTIEQSNQLRGIFQDGNTFAVDDVVVEQARAFLSETQLNALIAEQALQHAGPQKPGLQRAIHDNIPADTGVIGK